MSPTPTLHLNRFLASSFSTFIFHVFFGRLEFTSSCPSLKTPTLFSKHAHHPSSTHTCTILLCSPLPSESLFPSIPRSPFDSLSSFSPSSSYVHYATHRNIQVLLLLSAAFKKMKGTVKNVIMNLHLHLNLCVQICPMKISAW